QVWRSCGEQRFFFFEAEDRALLPAFPLKLESAEWVCEDQTFVQRPVEKVPQGFQIPVDGGFRKFSLLVSVLAVFAGSGFGDVADRDICEVGKEHFQAIKVP